jgi:predicted O-methyltransferase YrrM
LATDDQKSIPGGAGLTPAGIRLIPPEQVRRRFDYDRRLIPNAFVAQKDAASVDLGSAVQNTGLSMGYPAWNLLYYSLLCSLKVERPIVVETGTNLGYSTILMAQALKDARCRGVVFTVDIDAETVSRAKDNAAAAGMCEFIHFVVGDSLDFLSRIAAEHDRIDFAFLDGAHTAPRVIAEFEVIYPRLKACGGMVYFDNTTSAGVAAGLLEIRARFGGNLIQFENCSWAPPGAALWQP